MPSQGLRNARLFPIRQLFSAFLPPSGDDVNVGVVRKRPSGLLYDVDETPPLLVRLGVSFQHVFLLSVGWLYVLVIVNSIGGTEAEAQAIIRISMIAGGLATILQSTRGVLGSGYFCPILAAARDACSSRELQMPQPRCLAPCSRKQLSSGSAAELSSNI